MAQLRRLTCRLRVQAGLLLPGMFAACSMKMWLEGEVKTYGLTYGVCCCGAGLTCLKAL